MPYDPERSFDVEDTDEFGYYIAKPCLDCGEATQTRCGTCHAPVCHWHDVCPNGCEIPKREPGEMVRAKDVLESIFRSKK